MKKKKLFIVFSVAFSLFCLPSCLTLKDASTGSAIKDSKSIKLEENFGDKKVKKGKKAEINFSEGIVGIKIRPKLGTFNLNVINDKKKYIPVTYTGNEYSTTGFYLKINKKIYKLISDGAVDSEFKKTTNGVKIVYTLIDQAEVDVNLDYVKSTEDGETDMLRITVELTNISDKTNYYALKAIIDTILGESAGTHFYTREMVPINSEVSYKTMQNEKWFVSKNEKAGMEFFLDGLDITSPETVVLGNYSTLNSKQWIPEITNLKTFDTVLSYNNSAIGIIWPEVKLEKNKSEKFVFYIAFSNSSALPFGESLVFGIQKPQEIKEIKLPRPATDKIVSSVQIDEDSVNNLKRKVEVSSLSKNQLSHEYIQALLDRIEALEDAGLDSVNKWELMQLNDELDAILEYLRHN